MGRGFWTGFLAPGDRVATLWTPVRTGTVQKMDHLANRALVHWDGDPAQGTWTNTENIEPLSK
jgi:hypothetical protein